MATTSLGNLYQNVLGRPGDQGGMDYWNGKFGNDVDRNEANEFYSAVQGEQQKRMQNWNGTSVSDLYTNVLGRQGDQAGMDYWNNKLQTQGAGAVRDSFLPTADAVYQNKLNDLFNPNNGEVSIPSGTVDFSSINQNNPAPSYAQAQKPVMSDTYNKMYQNTFTNPEAYWNEYSQGQGAQATEAAARGMAATGHTGLMPTLQTQAHQSYMTDYLPTVRKGLAEGFAAENTANNTLAGMYGNEMNFNQGIYGTKTGLEQAKITAMTAAGNQSTQKAIAELETMAKNYGVDSQTMQQMYASMAQMFPNMGDADKQAFIAELAGAMGVSNYGGTNSAGLLK